MDTIRKDKDFTEFYKFLVEIQDKIFRCNIYTFVKKKYKKERHLKKSQAKIFAKCSDARVLAFNSGALWFNTILILKKTETIPRASINS